VGVAGCFFHARGECDPIMASNASGLRITDQGKSPPSWVGEASWPESPRWWRCKLRAPDAMEAQIPIYLAGVTDVTG
jgi:hypothetical protein